MLLYKLFSSFKIDGAINIFNVGRSLGRVRYFSRTKNTRLLNLKWDLFELFWLFYLQEKLQKNSISAQISVESEEEMVDLEDL